jgi:hypothetical protein
MGGKNGRIGARESLHKIEGMVSRGTKISKSGWRDKQDHAAKEGMLTKET